MSTILIDKLLSAAVERRASRIVLRPSNPCEFTVNGRLVTRISGHSEKLAPEDCLSLMKSITPDHSQQELQTTGAARFGFAFGDQATFDVSLRRLESGIELLLRCYMNGAWIDTAWSEAWCDVLSKRQGLCLVSGPPNSGKTHALASLFALLKKQDETSRGCIGMSAPCSLGPLSTHYEEIQRYTGNSNYGSFGEALYAAIPSSTTVLLIDDASSEAEIVAMIEAAEHGKLVLGTLVSSSVDGVRATLLRALMEVRRCTDEQAQSQLTACLRLIQNRRLLFPSNGSGQQVLAVEDREFKRQAGLASVGSYLGSLFSRRQSLETEIRQLASRGEISDEEAYRYL